MSFPILFGISAVFGMAAWGTVAWLYIWPALNRRPSPEKLATHPAAQCVQVSRPGVLGAGCCFPRVAFRIRSTRSLR